MSTGRRFDSMHSTRRSLLLACAGVLGARQAIAARWELLGVREVTDRVDHDTIAVTAVRGDYKAVKLIVRGSAVRFFRVVVHFANGGDQELAIRDLIPAGGETRAIDLRGHDRVIRTVDFWYEAKSLGARRAMISLHGLT